jgi:transaldolase
VKATQIQHNLSQSLWLDNITRDLLNSGTLKYYLGDLRVTGLTSNPPVIDHAIKSSVCEERERGHSARRKLRLSRRKHKNETKSRPRPVNRSIQRVFSMNDTN